MTTEYFVQILQASIAPCVFLSALGLLLLSMTNRLARPIDRIRALTAGLKGVPAGDVSHTREQIDILYSRCRLLQAAIALIAASIFFTSVIVLMLFSTLVFNIKLIAFIKLLFVASLISLIVSLIFFLSDIRLSLRSIKIEIGIDL